MNIRSAKPEDKKSLYKICLETGDSGSDASGQIRNQDLYGDIWVGPYLNTPAATCLVIEDSDSELLGYCLGASDSRELEEISEDIWWPQKRSAHLLPPIATKTSWSRDQHLQFLIHNPRTAPSDVYEQYPSHAHINLLASARGQGWGRKLMEKLEKEFKSTGSSGIHMILSANNISALSFYLAVGYKIFYQDSAEIVVVKSF